MNINRLIKCDEIYTLCYKHVKIMGQKSEIKQLKKERAKAELKIKLLTVVNNFKSEEEPNVKLNEIDIINVLSSIISRRTE